MSRPPTNNRDTVPPKVVFGPEPPPGLQGVVELPISNEEAFPADPNEPHLIRRQYHQGPVVYHRSAATSGPVEAPVRMPSLPGDAERGIRRWMHPEGVDLSTFNVMEHAVRNSRLRAHLATLAAAEKEDKEASQGPRVEEVD